MGAFLAAARPPCDPPRAHSRPAAAPPPRAQVPGNQAAIGQHFNLTGDRCYTFDGLVKAIAKVGGWGGWAWWVVG